jgi:hypothetical protein
VETQRPLREGSHWSLLETGTELCNCQPRVAGNRRSQEREHSPADTLASDFQPPDLGEKTLLLFEVTQFVALCGSSPKELRY